MATYETPGVHHERSDSAGGGIAALRTDVTGFVGIAEKGPLHLAVPVESMRQFEAWFGAQIDQGYLAYAARAFFENGGRRLWAVRVASPAASSAYATVYDAAGPAWLIRASNAGSWGNRLSVKIDEERRIQRRGRVDPLRADIIHIGQTGGLARAAMIELHGGSNRQRAVVKEVDPGAGRLLLEQPISGIGTGSAVRVETVNYLIKLYDSGRLVAQYDGLSAVPKHDRYAPAMLRQPWAPIDPGRPEVWTGNAPEPDVAVEFFRINAGRSGAVIPPLITVEELRDENRRELLNLFSAIAAGPGGVMEPVAGGKPVTLAGGGDGLSALSVSDFTGSGVAANASLEAIIASRRGIAALELVDEVSLIAVPDIHIRPRQPHPVAPPQPCIPDPCLPGVGTGARPPVPVGDLPPRFSLDEIALVQMAVVEQCERLRDRVALLDAPFDACNRATFAASDLRAWRSRFDTPFAALYAPWLKVSDTKQRGSGDGRLTRPVPPSGHVAGHCAAIDLRSGVHVAPANVPLRWCQAATLDVNDALHGLLNSLGVNVLKVQAGRGMRVLGARTMSSNPSWLYLNVRRLMSMIAEAIDLSIQWAVFESNDWRTRAKLQLAIHSFLTMLWSRGALAGAAPDEGFRVRCDESNNPSSQRWNGQLLIEVDVAPTKPFEFITLRIGREASGFAVADETAQAAA